ncbi:hypothetical protein [Clostridium sp.]|uniref:hypothetical protein n=1 Tax=Clostridium sp. TaxID=1506 RepID=UPI0032173887
MIKEIIILDMLTENSVSIVKQKVVVSEGIEYPFDAPHRRGYSNQEDDIKDMRENVPEPYLSTVLNLWGVLQ